MILSLAKNVSKVIQEVTPEAVTAGPDAATPAAQAKSFAGTSAPQAGGLPQVIFYLFNFLVFIYLVFFWLFLVRWTGEDAKRRGVSAGQRQIYQLLVLVFTLPGLLLYSLLRPAMTSEERKRAEMEEEVLKLELEKLRRESPK